MSVITMSKVAEFNFWTASLADAAVSTSKPFISRIALSVSRIASSSSASRMRRFMITPGGYLLTAVEMPEAAWELLIDRSHPSPKAASSPHPYNCTRGKFLFGEFRMSGHTGGRRGPRASVAREGSVSFRPTLRRRSHCFEYLYGHFLGRSGRTINDPAHPS